MEFRGGLLSLEDSGGLCGRTTLQGLLSLPCVSSCLCSMPHPSRVFLFLLQSSVPTPFLPGTSPPSHEVRVGVGASEGLNGGGSGHSIPDAKLKGLVSKHPGTEHKVGEPGRALEGRTW